MKKIAILFLVALFFGCAPMRKTTYVPVQGENRIEYRDSVIHIIDTIKVEVPKEKIVEVIPDIDTSRLETKLAVSTAFLDKDKGCIHHTLEHKPEALKTRIDTVVTVQYKNHYLERPVITEVEVPTPYIPKVFWWLLGYCGITVVFGVLKITRRI